MRVGSLFSGIGGLELGLERAGMTVCWQVEIDDYCRRVLVKHWPDVPRYEDVREVGAHNLEPVDLICGGFPCQDISYAGKGAGLEGERSGLWYEFARVVRELRPRYVLVENVPALLTRGLDAVLGTLASFGYDAEWDCIPAAAVGAPHRRDRVFVVAYPAGTRRGARATEAGRPARRAAVGLRGEEPDPPVADDPGDGRGARRSRRPHPSRSGEPEQSLQDVADPRSGGRDGRPERHLTADEGRGEQAPRRDHPLGCAGENGRPEARAQGERREPGDWWSTEPDVGRVADGVPARVDRLRGLGNAVVPQVAEWIGRRIMAADAARRESEAA